MSSPAHASELNSTLLPPTGSMSIPAVERAFFENSLGNDFSHVRVHTDERAAAVADAMGAKAFAVGNEIVFGEGRYQPGTTEGRRLLAHELTHVAQQSRGGSTSTDTEPRARAAADRAANGASVSAEAQGGASTGVQCDDDDKKKADATPAPSSIPSPAASPGGASLGAAGLSFPGLSSGFQLSPPQLMPPTFGNRKYSPPSLTPGLTFPGLAPGAEGPLPLPRLPMSGTPSLPPPLPSGNEPKLDWLPLQNSYQSRGSMISDRDADAIMQTWDMNSQLLTTFGITDRFKFLFITKEWILNKGMQKQIEDLQIRENPNSFDKADAEFKRAYPGGWATPMVPIFDLDWFRPKK